LGFLLVACADQSLVATRDPTSGEIGQVVEVEGGGQYFDIVSSELNDMLNEKDFFLVNVLDPSEGDIPGTDASIPVDQVSQRLSEFPDAKDAKIVIYCRRGNRSVITAKILIAEGYTNVFNLNGGVRAWADAGYVLEP
jgi:rhodanese-related sulfurtransferase